MPDSSRSPMADDTIPLASLSEDAISAEMARRAAAARQQRAVQPTGGRGMSAAIPLSTLVQSGAGERYQFWPERALRDLVALPENTADAALMNQHRFAATAGTEIPESRLQAPLVERAADAALALGVGGGATAGLRPSGSAGIFGGRLAKTADHAALDLAEQMAAKGMDRRQIWDATGWFQGAEGKWRFEIPDHNLSVARGYGEDLLFGKIAHEDLAKAYSRYEEEGGFPHHIDIARANEPKGTYHVDTSPQLEYDFGHRQYLPTITVEAPSRKMARSIVGHELQHDVQFTEGFAGGANPSMMRDYARQAGAAGDDVNKAGYEAYRRMAGEVEARNVQKRLDMTPEQRRATPPWRTWDVPLSQQIIRGQVPFSSLAP